MKKIRLVLITAILSMSGQLSNGQDYLGWAHTIGGMTEEIANDMVVDDDENIYIVGELHGPVNMNPAGNFSISPPVGNLGVYVAKYDKTGAFVWAIALDADSGSEITLNAAGSVIVTGTFTDTATFGTTTVKNSLSSTVNTIYVASFDKSNGAFQGAGVIEGTGDQKVFDIKPSGNSLILAGSFKGTADFDITANQANQNQTGSVNNLFVAKFSDQGALAWVHSIAGNSTDNSIDDLEADDSENVYAVGRLWETLDFQNGTNLNGAVGQRPESFIFKLASDGSFLWSHTGAHSGGNSRSGYYSLELDGNGDLTIAGFIQGTVVLGGFSGSVQSQNATPDILVAKYAPDGTAIASHVLGGGSQQFALVHALDAQGNYIISGVAQGPNNDFDPDPDGITSLGFSTTNQFDVFIAKYNSDLTFQWANGFLGSTLNDWVHGLAASPEGNIYISGYVQDDVDFDFDDNAVVKNGITGGRDLYIASIHNVAVLNQQINLCDGATVQVGNSTYDAIGSYQDVFTGGRSTGQDSVVNTTILSLLDPITLSVSTTSPSCVGDNDGSVTVNASDAGTRNYQYSINGITGQSSSTFTGLVAGNYTIWVQDQDGCVASMNFQIQAPTPITITPTLNHVQCNGEQSGSIQMAATGGEGPYTYSFNGEGFGTGDSFTLLAAGTYDVAVKDAKGCTATTSVTITEPDALLLLEDTLTDPSCAGEASGLIDVAAFGGTAPYEYSIDGVNFGTGHVFDNLVAGNYSLTVKDANGCTNTLLRTLTAPTALTVQSTSLTDVDCRGSANGAVTIAGQGGTPGANGYQYKIDEGSYQSGGTFSGLQAGAYTITVKDENNCTATLNIDIDEPDPFGLNTTHTNVTCNGEDDGAITVNTVTGGVAPYEYSLDGVTYSSSSSFDKLPPGNYSVSVKDANGCITTQAFLIEEPQALIIQFASVTDVLCFGDNTGAVSLSATGGTGTKTYSMDGVNFQSQSSFTGLAAGNYTFTVADENDCRSSASVTIIQPVALNLAFEKVDVTCNGAGDGQIAGAASGGNGPYSYSLDGINFQTGVFSNLAPGNYTLTARDANECTTTTSIVISEPIPLAISTTKTDITCKGLENGTINVSAAGGTAPYRFRLNDVILESSQVTQLAPGSYSLKLTDANLCEVTSTVVIEEPDALTLTAVATDVTCNGAADGQVALTGAGGTGPYEYSLDGTTFQTTASFNNLAPEIYTIMIRDANGCTATASSTITEPDVLSVTVSLSNFNTITAMASGGTAPYEYAIDGTYQSSGTFSDLGNGNYTVTVRDANGCTVSASQALIVTSADNPLLTPVIRSYPNPAQDYLMISKVDKGDIIQLISLNGRNMSQTLIQKAQSEYKQDISTMRDSMFLLVITDKSGRPKLRHKVIRVK